MPNVRRAMMAAAGQAGLDYTVHWSDTGNENHTLPATIADGDIGILFEGFYEQASLVTPATGWLLGKSYQYSTYQGAALYYKLLTTSDASTLLTTIDGTSAAYDASIAVVLRPSREPSALSIFGADADGTTSAIDVTTDMSLNSGFHRLYLGCAHVVNSAAVDYPLVFSGLDTPIFEGSYLSSGSGNMRVCVVPSGDTPGTITGNNESVSKFNTALSLGVKITL